METHPIRILVVAASSIAGIAIPAEAGEWKAGVARQVITPDEPQWLAGYGHRTHPAEGKVHDLWVKALALEDAGGRRAVLVSSDHLGYTRAIAGRIAAEAERKFGIGQAALMLTASHTHSGPVLEDALIDYYPLDASQTEKIAAYTRRLEAMVVETVGRAIGALAPAAVSHGLGTADFAVNRRTNREAEVPDLIARKALKGPVDHRVPVLAVRDGGGRLIAVAFGYACHNTVLDTYPWCGDYAGFAQVAIEEGHPGATALFWAGCGADQNPLPRRSLDLCAGYGRRLAAAVEEVLGGTLRPVTPKLRAAGETVTLEYEKTSSRADLEAATSSTSPIRARWGKKLLARLDRGEDLGRDWPYSVAGWRLGDDLIWLAMGGEAVVDYALRFREELGPATWTAAFAGDVMGYIPSRRVWEEGGYEAGALFEYGHPAERWKPDVEDKIAAAVGRVAGRLRGIASVRKDLYRRHPRPGAAALAAMWATGPGLERMEFQGVEARDDVPSEMAVRFSADGGRTWSEFAPLPETIRRIGDIEVWEGAGAKLYDPGTGVLVDVWLRQIARGGIYNNFTYSRISRDGGRSWTAPRQLRYEEGEDFDPGDPLKPGFLGKNQAYFGSGIVRLSDGALLHPVAHAKAPGDADDARRPWKMGSLCFRGEWDPAAGDYRWTAGKRHAISPEVSSRGLMEPDAAELAGGRVLIVWRGSDTPKTPGRKWFAVSEDGGRTLGEVRELRHDDGGRFHSPSSIHRLLRHGKTGKLYWIGNICREPPRGNWPRYPLVIHEVDEAIPALRRNAVTVINDRGPGQSDQVQFSNFSLVEDRETGEIEMLLTTYGQDAKAVFDADCYFYRVALGTEEG